jgi:hypothetical protein
MWSAAGRWLQLGGPPVSHALGDSPSLVYNLIAMNESEFFIPLPNAAALRVRYLKDRGRILRFVVQLH